LNTNYLIFNFFQFNIFFIYVACGGRLQATSGVKHLYSHATYGDHNYDNKADCDWTIEAKPGQNVHLKFLTFELEDETDCSYDYVEVYSGLDDSGPEYGRSCGHSVSS
jgi:tolkin protein